MTITSPQSHHSSSRASSARTITTTNTTQPSPPQVKFFSPHQHSHSSLSLLSLLYRNLSSLRRNPSQPRNQSLLKNLFHRNILFRAKRDLHPLPLVTVGANTRTPPPILCLSLSMKKSTSLSLSFTTLMRSKISSSSLPSRLRSSKLYIIFANLGQTSAAPPLVWQSNL